MPGSVADASVIGALVFGEKNRDEAAAMLRGHRLFEPPLLLYELASIARKKVVRAPAEREAVFQGLSEGLALDASWVDVHQPSVLRLALETGLTTYDASYLFLSRQLGIPLLTFDDTLRDVVERGPGRPGRFVVERPSPAGRH